MRQDGKSDCQNQVYQFFHAVLMFCPFNKDNDILTIGASTLTRLWRRGDCYSPQPLLPEGGQNRLEKPLCS